VLLGPLMVNIFALGVKTTLLLCGVLKKDVLWLVARVISKNI